MSIRKEKIAFFETQLRDFFHKVGRDHLPWRKRGITAYEVWVSEIMLQQTQVSRVIRYYNRFLERFPNIEALAKATWDDFLPYYEGLGYYARGRNMLRAAQVIVKEYGGQFPRDKEVLQKIPGIGPYTASAIMSFAYGDQHLAWDTNVKRVIGRFFLGGKGLITGESEWESRLATPRKKLNAALMDFGSSICVARPKCEACMLRTKCVYYREKGKQEARSMEKGVRSKEKIDWKEAEAHVFLHENHRIYYSAAKKSFNPFVLPAGFNSRAGIKDYFQKNFQLSLAVRPPHRKIMMNGRPVLYVNAQILLGKPAFDIFPKSAILRYTKDKDQS